METLAADAIAAGSDGSMAPNDAAPARSRGPGEAVQLPSPPAGTAPQLADQRDLKPRRPASPPPGIAGQPAAEVEERSAARTAQPTAPIPPQAVPVQPAFLAAAPAAESMARQGAISEVAVNAGSEISLPDMAPAERGGADAAQRTTTAIVTPPELPRAVAAQIIEAMRAGTGIVDVTLWPEELGRLTLSLAAQDGAMSVTVAADRPETLELIRRHMEVLLEEARSAGFSDVAFGFAGEGNPGADQEAGEDNPTGASTPAAPSLREVPEAPRSAAVTGRLDLRI